MVKCGVCGSENEPEAQFCGACGSRLTPEVVEQLVDDAKQGAGGDGDVVIPGSGGRGRVPGEGPDAGPDTIVDGQDATETVAVGGGPTVTCAVCGTVNDATRTYCRKCANELRPAAPPPPPPPPVRDGPRITPLMIGIGVAALLGVGLLAVVLSGALDPPPIATASPAPTGTSAPTAPATDAPATDAPTPTPPVVTEGDVPTGRILFVRCPAAGGPCQLIIRNADGSGGGTRITGSPEGAGDPGFSNDGRRVAYSTTVGLRILTLEPGFPFVPISDNATDTNAFWSPNDDSIAFSRDQNQSREIRILDVLTGSSERLTDNDVEDHDPVFTPDGDAIIWVEGIGDDRELMRMDLATGAVESLTDDDFNDVDPVVSPDGRRLAFVSNRESGDQLELFVMDLETLDITRLFGVDDGDVHDPSWSPGGRFLAVTAGPRNNRDILIFDTVSGDVTELTSNPDSDLSPAWR